MKSNSNTIRVPYNTELNRVMLALRMFGSLDFRSGAIIGFFAVMFFFGMDGYIGGHTAESLGWPWVFESLRLLGLPINARGASYLFQAIFFGGLTVGTVLFAVSAMLGEQDLVIMPDWIHFPVSFAAGLRNRRQRLWTDVSAVTVTTGENVSQAKLIIWFKSGGKAIVKLNCLPANQIEQLALAIEMRAPQVTSPDLNAFLDMLNERKNASGELSFTCLWEKDMNYRFQSVVFVPLAPNQSLKNGQIKIQRQLCFGGLSAIYLAQKSDGERIIVKEVALPATADSVSRAKAESMLQREADLLLKLSHPQIVKIRDVFEENGKTYLLLDYLPGENLRQIVAQNSPVSEDQVLEWGIQIAQILEYLHSQDPPIVHRDISPDNLIVGADGKLVLIDFGAANEFMSSATGTMIGKQAYVAPEQFKGKATIQSDIYALGATMHFLLTGKDPEALSESHPRVFNIAVSERTDQIVADCTRLDCDNRIRSAQEVLLKLSPTIDLSSMTIRASEKVLYER